MINATGWTELLNGNMVGAAYTMYVADLSLWVIPALFITFQIMVYLKTDNLTLMWVTGMIFASLYVGTTATMTTIVMKPIIIPILGLILVLELGGIFYYYMFM